MYDSQKAHYLVVTGILIKDNKFLITKRAPTEKAFPNQWTVPGGKLELDDYAKRPKDTSAHWYNVFEDLLKRKINPHCLPPPLKIVPSLLAPFSRTTPCGLSAVASGLITAIIWKISA